MAELISIREFAGRDDCNDKLVRRAIEQGHLVANEDKKLDAALVGSGWRRGNRKQLASSAVADTVEVPAADKSAPARERAPAPAPAPRGAENEAEQGAEGVIPKLAESEARRVHFLSLQRELEYRKLHGQLVEIDVAKRVLFDEFRAARDAWLKWPGNCAALIAAELGAEPGRVLEVLTVHVRKQIAGFTNPSGREFEG